MIRDSQQESLSYWVCLQTKCGQNVFIGTALSRKCDSWKLECFTWTCPYSEGEKAWEVIKAKQNPKTTTKTPPQNNSEKQHFIFCEWLTLICFVSGWTIKLETSNTPMGAQFCFLARAFHNLYLVKPECVVTFKMPGFHCVLREKIARLVVWTACFCWGVKQTFSWNHSNHRRRVRCLSGGWLPTFYCSQFHGQLPGHYLGDLGLSDFNQFWSEPHEAELTFLLTAFNMWNKDLLKYQRKMHRPPVIC